MGEGADAIRIILGRLRESRERAGVSREDVERGLILGPGWVARFESGDTVPNIDLLIALSNAAGTDLATLVDGVQIDEAATVRRALYAEPVPGDIRLHFPYGEFDASYDLEGASLEELERVLQVLRDGLAAGNKTEAVKDAFLAAAQTWPAANPSDLWGFVILRAYLDPYNHPAGSARLNFEQSWKRTSGWALERVLVEHYRQALERCGVRIFVATAREKTALLPSVELARRLNEQKVDAILSGRVSGKETFFGVVHVKASLAERRTDDVPLSENLIQAGYTSVFWTMDLKSMPSARPLNRGELGAVLQGENDSRSEKRRDFEDEGSFSACFSYNSRTAATPVGQGAKARIYTLDFANPDDAFAEFVCAAWRQFMLRTGAEAR